jgi:hypothetical protein
MRKDKPKPKKRLLGAPKEVEAERLRRQRLILARGKLCPETLKIDQTF